MSDSKSSVNLKKRFSYDKLDRTLHEQARVGIMTSLVTYSDGLSFNQLKQLCDLTDGNLNRHLKVLIDAGYVKSEKNSLKRETSYVATKTGKGKFAEYIDELKRVVTDAVKNFTLTGV